MAESQGGSEGRHAVCVCPRIFTRQWWGISCGQAEGRSPGGDQVPGRAKQGKVQAWGPVTEGLLGEREQF